MHLLLKVLSKYTKLSESFQDFVDQVTCDPSFYDCNYRKCDNFTYLLDTFKHAVKQCENIVRYTPLYERKTSCIYGRISCVM